MKRKKSLPPSRVCEGKTADGSRCRLKTTADSLCWIHQQKEEKVRVKKSTIRGAGKGLFASKWRGEPGARVFKKGERITSYDGKHMSMKEADKKYPGNSGDYLLQVSKTTVIDAARPTSCLGRFVNTHRATKKKPNAKLAVGGGRASVKALRSIKQGEELLASYGSGRGLGFVPISLPK